MAHKAQGAAVPLPFVAEHHARRQHLAGAERGWLAALREQAIASWQAQGFPGPRTEAWKFTSTRVLAAEDWRPAAEVEVQASDLPQPLDERADRLVFVNGRLARGHSSVGALPVGAQIASLRALLEAEADQLGLYFGRTANSFDGRPFLALNTAFAEDGAALILPRNAVLERPLEIVHLALADGTPALTHPRLLVVLGEGARAQVVERFHTLGQGRRFTNAAAEIALGAGAHLFHLRLQEESGESFHVSSASVRVGGDAVFAGFSFTTGARWSRIEQRTQLAAPGAVCHLDGAAMLAGSRHGDFTSIIEHAEPHGTSNQTFKNVIADTARAVFQGRILVRPQAQKTDGYQRNDALLLSPTAEIDAKPELEIHADDVKCSHGATAGQLEGEALFYLRSRGIPEAEARALLVQAFVGNATRLIADETLRDALDVRVEAWVLAYARSGGRA